jgi:shikimate kinase
MSADREVSGPPALLPLTPRPAHLLAPSLPKKLLYLIGYRGTGKTTVAHMLARQLGWGWRDADAVLEARHGRTIRSIFAEEGEEGFRAKESVILEELSELRQHVIATGGGVILSEANFRRLRESGTVFWLTADAPTLWQRLQRDDRTPDQRPLLTVGGLAEIEEVLARRRPLYAAAADATVETAGRTPDEVAAAILTLLSPS